MTRDRPWDVQDPAGVIGEMLRRRRPRPGDVLVGAVEAGDQPDQALIKVVRVHRGELPQRHDASDLLRTHAEAMLGVRTFSNGRWMPPSHVFVTAVCRSGRVVPGPNELFWMMAWRYSNHLAGAFNGDVYLVTEHGWTGYLDERAGFTPALRPTPGHLASVGTTKGRRPR